MDKTQLKEIYTLRKAGEPSLLEKYMTPEQLAKTLDAYNVSKTLDDFYSILLPKKRTQKIYRTKIFGTYQQRCASLHSGHYQLRDRIDWVDYVKTGNPDYSVALKMGDFLMNNPDKTKSDFINTLSDSDKATLQTLTSI
jgi:hypothetical protein